MTVVPATNPKGTRLSVVKDKNRAGIVVKNYRG
jgi:hypothetical protein